MSEINVTKLALSQGSATVTRMGHLLGYARVSTTDQQPQLQVDALERAGCFRVFTETASGARTDRPTLEQLLDQLRPGPARVIDELMGHQRSRRGELEGGQPCRRPLSAHYPGDGRPGRPGA